MPCSRSHQPWPTQVKQRAGRAASESPGAIIRAGGIPAAVAHFDRIAVAALDPAARAQPRPLTPVSAMLLGTTPAPAADSASAPAARPEPVFCAVGSAELLPNPAACMVFNSAMGSAAPDAVLLEVGSPARSAACAIADIDETVESTPLTAGIRSGAANATACEGVLRWNHYFEVTCSA